MGKGRVRVKQIGGGGPKMPINPLADLAVPPDEMIHLPTRPDSNSGFMIWPMGETFTMKYKTFSAIYPNYIDSDKTVKLGRRIAAKDAVPGPTMQDIHEGLVRLDVRHVIQPHKGYSRDAVSRWDNPGRILVDLEGATQSGILDASPDGVYEMDDAIPDMVDEDGDGRDGRNGGRGKKQLLRKLAHVISGLPNRHRRLEAARSKQLEEEKLRQASADNVVSKAGTATSGGGGNRKKKGKKKL